MAQIKLRSPSADELPVMRHLYKEMYETIGSSEPPAEWVTNVHQQSLSGERSYWFALLDEEIIGFVDFKVMLFHPGSDEKFARIFDLFIRQSMHRRGYGTQLARKTINSVIEQGASNIELNVLPNNDIALAFWRSLGFNLHLYVLQMSV
ncbi:GNAT family N-acetyltransferase [Chlorogloeopsis sp. ULAP01]|uniref:GNAT family N-acetyltransferase n=1 Tax=Chlorogloeopsis sp. ULAP01 TaxID=3056483 RepID=UPI0025AB2057|nr:GNAT family N-acetyltransferase [Chlorogloeopsis sp. ULAP01]MDM9383073.1 GNAT family N-acetyltransferase [Chlorogloeopsis sp. ULAP01]